MKRVPAFAAAVAEAEADCLPAGRGRLRKKRECLLRTPEKAEQLCTLLRSGSTELDAVREVGMSRHALFLWIDQDPEFAKKIYRAKAAGSVARRRALGDKQSKRSPMMVRRLCRLLRKGATRKDAYLSVGISAPTFHFWMKKDPRFAAMVTRSEAVWVNRTVESITGAMNRDWRAAAWLLSKKRPKEFGRDGDLSYYEEEPCLSEEEVLQALAELKERVDRRRALANASQSAIPNNCST
jgi:hypothetical protein